jgi:hypothetical protein
MQMIVDVGQKVVLAPLLASWSTTLIGPVESMCSIRCGDDALASRVRRVNFFHSPVDKV